MSSHDLDQRAWASQLQLATQLADLLDARDAAASQIEEMFDAHPLSRVLTSMPGIGVRTGTHILLEVGDGSSFPTAGHLAAYASLAPVTPRSGSSIRGEHPSRSGNKNLKRAFFLAAFAALQDPASRTYYDRKRAAGKKHNAAMICLARRRVDVLYSMLKHRECGSGWSGTGWHRVGAGRLASDVTHQTRAPSRVPWCRSVHLMWGGRRLLWPTTVT